MDSTLVCEGNYFKIAVSPSTMPKGKKQHQYGSILNVLKNDARSVNQISKDTGLAEERVIELLNLLISEGKIGKIIGGNQERYYHKNLSHR